MSRVVALLLLVAAGCADETAAGEVPEPDLPLAWVSPSRCLAPCTAAPALVPIDELGQLAGGGRHRVLAIVQGPLRALVAAARVAGHGLALTSSFRSYDEQAMLFATTTDVGRAARPGHSEHQLGAAVDVSLPSSAAIAWLASHALDFGFALSYPPGSQRTTGYRPEPWHVRFVGATAAAELRASGATLEELFRARPDLGRSGDCADCPLDASRPPCGSLSADGTCAGTVLSWCYDGALAAVDCAATALRCAPGPPADCR
jgi:LAS superfamily LD-carboxypeptidase LdcB